MPQFGGRALGALPNCDIMKYNWTSNENLLHINVLELIAVFNGLGSFAKNENDNILLRVDSVNAMAYINIYGGCRSQDLHNVAKQIWSWCQKRNIMFYATDINRKENIVVDRLSRTSFDQSDF